MQSQARIATGAPRAEIDKQYSNVPMQRIGGPEEVAAAAIEAARAGAAAAGDGRADVQFNVMPLSVDKPGDPLHDYPGFSASVCQCRPLSRGSVQIRSGADGKAASAESLAAQRTDPIVTLLRLRRIHVLMPTMSTPPHVLELPAFRRFLISRALSSTAFQATSVAIGWLVYDRTRNPFDLGLVGLFQFLPMLLLTLVAGQLADQLYLHLVAQGLGLAIPSSLLAMLPYVATILVLVLLSRDALRTRLYAPVSLGQPWQSGH